MKVLIKLIGVAILMACFGWLIFCIVAFVALLSVGYFRPFNGLPYDLLRHHHGDYIFVAAFVSVVIPLIAIILLVLKGIFNIGGINRSTGAATLVVWLCAVGALIFNIVGIASEFNSHANLVETIALTPAKNNTYHIKLNDLMYLTAEDSTRLHIRNLSPNIRVRDDDDNDFPSFSHRNIRLNIETSDSGQPVLIKSLFARGAYDEQAFNNARNIKYVFTQQDSILKFDQRYYGKNNELWHDEEIELTLKLPMNAKVVIDHDVERIANFSIRDCNIDNKKDYDRVSDATFLMTNNGLQCKVDTMVTDTIIRRHLPADSSKIKIK